MHTTPFKILNFVRRGSSMRDYARLKAALDRLQSTSIATSIRAPTGRRLHRFSWINEWKERADIEGRPLGIELVLPDWFYAEVVERSLILTIDRELHVRRIVASQSLPGYALAVRRDLAGCERLLFRRVATLPRWGSS